MIEIEAMGNTLTILVAQNTTPAAFGLCTPADRPGVKGAWWALPGGLDAIPALRDAIADTLRSYGYDVEVR